MFKDKIKRLTKLNEKELEFYFYSLDNYEVIVESPIPELAKKYGTGVSFIYNFFEKMGFASSKII